MYTYHIYLNIKTKHLVDWTGDSETLVQPGSDGMILNFKDRYTVFTKESVNMKKIEDW